MSRDPLSYFWNAPEPLEQSTVMAEHDEGGMIYMVALNKQGFIK